MRIIIIIFIILPFLSFSQINQIDSNGLRQGLWKKEQSNGQLMYEGYFKDGKPVGEWKRFHEGGQVKAIIKYDEESDSAFVQLFDVWQKKVAEGNYLNEKKSGNWVMFSNNQEIAREEYDNGIKNGISIKFYETGEVFEEAEWKNGIQDGKYQVLYTNGEPLIQCLFSNNMRNGIFISYYQNGRAEMKANYKNNLRHDEWKFYNEAGEYLYSLYYNEGVILNPEVRDSIDNIQMQNLEKGKNSILDPEKFMQDPTEYMMKNGIIK